MNENKPLLFTLKMGFTLAVITALVLVVSSAFTGYLESKNSSTSLPVFDKTHRIRFVIDPGHGGEDAGAIAADGTLEKDLNLSVALLLSTALELNGCEVALTRENDKLLYDYYGDLDDYTGQKKVYDLKNRLKIAEEKENSIYVGIHMNKFPEAKYSGLQVYYSQKNDLSYQLATDIKSAVFENLQPNNRRQIKAASNSIYVLHNATVPAVLIECGFLSNQEELELLKNEDYQKKLCLTLFSALCKYSS